MVRKSKTTQFMKKIIKNASEQQLLNILAKSRNRRLKAMAKRKLKRIYGWKK